MGGRLISPHQSSQDVSDVVVLTNVLSRRTDLLNLFPNQCTLRHVYPLQVQECRELFEEAKKALTTGNSYLYAVEASSEIIDAGGTVIGNQLRHDCLCLRASAFLKVYILLSITPI